MIYLMNKITNVGIEFNDNILRDVEDKFLNTVTGETYSKKEFVQTTKDEFINSLTPEQKFKRISDARTRRMENQADYIDYVDPELGTIMYKNIVGNKTIDPSPAITPVPSFGSPTKPFPTDSYIYESKSDRIKRLLNIGEEYQDPDADIELPKSGLYFISGETGKTILSVVLHHDATEDEIPTNLEYWNRYIYGKSDLYPELANIDLTDPLCNIEYGIVVQKMFNKSEVGTEDKSTKISSILNKHSTENIYDVQTISVIRHYGQLLSEVSIDYLKRVFKLDNDIQITNRTIRNRNL